MNSYPKTFLKFNKQGNLFFYIVIFFSLLSIVFWSFRELSVLGADFGTYYIEAKYASNDFSLYREIFEHKGPAFLYFLKKIGEIIGWGKYKAIISIIFGNLVFFLPSYYLINKFIKNNIEKILLLLIATCLLIGQDGNSTISFFKEGLLLVSLSRILFFKKNLNNFLITIIFFWLSFFVRVDGIIFFPIILIYFIKNLIFHKNLTKRIFLLLIFTLSPIILFNYFSNFFGFNFNDYWIHNVYFNNWYSGVHVSSTFISKIQHLFFRPKGLLLSTQSLILPYLFYILLIKLGDINKINLKNLILKIKSSGALNFNSLIIIISFLAYLITQSDKNYYVLIFLCPAFLVLIKEFSTKNNNQFVFLPILIFVFALNTSYLMENIKIVMNDLPAKVPYQKTIDYAKNKKLEKLEIIGGQGWTFILSETQPVRSIVDSWIYKPNKPYLTKYLLSQHDKLIKQKSGYLFWIENGLLKYKKGNKYLNELISNSNLIENQDYYSMYKIK